MVQEEYSQYAYKILIYKGFFKGLFDPYPQIYPRNYGAAPVFVPLLDLRVPPYHASQRSDMSFYFPH
jgi:hypothetical protein